MRAPETSLAGAPVGDIVSVTGGAHGIAAQRSEALTLAALYDDAADALLERAVADRRMLTDGDLVASAALAPGTFAAAEAAVLEAAALLVAAAAAWELTAVGVRTAIGLLEGADDAVRDGFDVLDRQALVGLVGLTGPSLPVALPLLGIAAGTGVADDVLAANPLLVERLANGIGPLGMGLLAAAYGPERRAAARPYPAPPGPLPQRRPRDLVGLVDGLAAVARLSGRPDSPANGTIAIQTTTAADGTRRHVVYLPGTDDLATKPWTRDRDVRDLPTSLRMLAGRRDAYRDGVVEAMRRAGVRRDEPVLVAGHSQGGMAAAGLLGREHGYRVTDVVTLGSPTAQVAEIPEGTSVLSLEHVDDVVPHLDGEPNPDTREQVTVRFDSPVGGPAEAHGHEAYRSGALAVAQSDDPSVRAGVDRLGAFLGPEREGERTSSGVWQVTRAP